MMKRENSKCFVSSYLSNPGRLIEDAEAVICNLETWSSITKLFVLQISRACRSLQEWRNKGKFNILRLRQANV
jgi:hypothetical protein